MSNTIMTDTTIIERYPLKARVDLTGLVNNLGSSYTNISQPIHELIDNALSSIRANMDSKNPKLIRITLVELGAMVEFTIEDTGSGIADIDSAMVIANTSRRQTVLNEHGQGLKQVIAYAVKNGGDWSLETRGALERELHTSWAITAPNNKLDGTLELLSLDEWHGELSGTGTIIHISCPYALFSKLAPVSNEKVPFMRLANILEEDLRYTYADAIRVDDASFELVCVPALGKEERRTLKPLEPNWTDDYTDIPPTVIDLGGGPVTVSGRYGLIKASENAEYTRITRELFVFATLGVRDRLDLFTCTRDGAATAYEGKAKNTKTADVYQLRRYWDGCVKDGVAVTEGVLIASKHNKDVRSLVAYINSQTGEDGRPYRFRLAT